MAKNVVLNNLPQDEILWKDRKRILGMPISFTAYSVDNDRLTCKKGFFKTEINELLLYRILDIKSTRTLGQKLFGVGTITLYSADQSNPTHELKNIRKPDAVRKFLSKLVERERTEKGLVGREIYGTGAASMMASDSDCGCPEHGHGPGPMPPHEFVDVDGDGIPD